MRLLNFPYQTILIFLFTSIANSINAQSLEYEFLYKISLSIDKPFEIGQSPYGTRIAYPIKGGTFEGPKMKGTVKEVGEDWLLKVDEATNKLDVRLVLETEDGSLISCTYKGINHKNPDGSFYWRITPSFETSAVRYDWLNYIVAVGKGSFVDGKVTYEVYAIK
jgi:Protein of unknown function (DUF3237)